MTKLIRMLGAVLLAGVAAFCVFGFLAAPEAGADAGTYRLLYGVIGAVSIGTAGCLVWPRPSGSARR